MKKITISKIKSRVPFVKRKSYIQQRDRSDRLENQAGQLYWHIEQITRELVQVKHNLQRVSEYNKWMAINYPSIATINKQRLKSTEFLFQPKVSIILPVYNTNPVYLEACISSVIEQSYVNWELCIVDDASDSEEALNVLNTYETGSDPRIKIMHSKKNGHISVSSNLAIEMATGEFIALLDHDDILWPNALFEVVTLLQDHQDADFVYSDEDKVEGDGFVHYNPYFKPDWSPHLLECVNYITHFSVLRTSIVKDVGCFDSHMVGAQDWDLFLRVSEKTDKIYHVPTILYSWRAHEGSTALSYESKSYVFANQRVALTNHFQRAKPQYVVELKVGNYNFYEPHYAVIGKPLVSIIVPTKDKVEYLQRCIDSVLNKTVYRNYEIIIVDTGSVEESTNNYYKSLKSNYNDKKLRIEEFAKQPFNYSEACNYGAKRAKGEYLIMLNNDTEVQTDTWVEDMLGYAQQPDIAAVGVKLLYPNGLIQHAGVAMGIGSWEPVAGHPGIQMPENDSSDSIQLMYTHTVRDVSGVTAACLMVSTEKFWQVKGFDPKYRVTFNDVDLNLKFREAGYLNIYLPFVKLLHDESISIGRAMQDRDMAELNKSAQLMRKRWTGIVDSDPYYNRNFFILSSQFGLDVYPENKKNN